MIDGLNLAILLLATIGGLPFLVFYLAEHDVFSPIGFLGLGYLINIIGPTLDYASNGTRPILFNEPLSYLISPLLLVVVCIYILLWGYTSRIGNQLAVSTPQPFNRWHPWRAIGTALFFTLIGVVSYAVFVTYTGGIPTTFAELSQKRRPPTEYLRWGVSFIYVASLIYWTTILHENWRLHEPKSLPGIPLLLLSLTFPIYTSSRSQLILLVAMHLLLFHYHRRYLSARGILTLAPITLLTANAMYVVRRTGSVTSTEVLNPMNALQGVIGARRNGITAIAHIYHLAGDELSYLWGTSLIHWVVFPVPRAVWPAKPMNIGQYLGAELYGRGVGIVGAGTPPTLIGELYLNGGLLFLLPGMFIFGVLVRWGYLYFNPLETKNPLNILLYAVFAVEICLRGLTGNWSLSMVGFLMWLLPLLFAGVLISLPEIRERYLWSTEHHYSSQAD